MSWKISIRSGPQEGATFDLGPQPLLIGGSPKADLLLNDPGADNTLLKLQTSSHGNDDSPLFCEPLEGDWIDTLAQRNLTREHLQESRLIQIGETTLELYRESQLIPHQEQALAQSSQTEAVANQPNHPLSSRPAFYPLRLAALSISGLLLLGSAFYGLHHLHSTFLRQSDRIRAEQNFFDHLTALGLSATFEERQTTISGVLPDRKLLYHLRSQEPSGWIFDWQLFVVDDARERLALLSAVHDNKISFDLDESGNVRLTALLKDVTKANMLRERLLAAFSRAPELTLAIYVEAELSRHLNKLLSQNGFRSLLSVSLGEKGLRVDGLLPFSLIPAYHSAVDEWRMHYPDIALDEQPKILTDDEYLELLVEAPVSHVSFRSEGAFGAVVTKVGNRYCAGAELPSGHSVHKVDATTLQIRTDLGDLVTFHHAAEGLRAIRNPDEIAQKHP